MKIRFKPFNWIFCFKNKYRHFCCFPKVLEKYQDSKPNLTQPRTKPKGCNPEEYWPREELKFKNSASRGKLKSTKVDEIKNSEKYFLLFTFLWLFILTLLLTFRQTFLGKSSSWTPSGDIFVNLKIIIILMLVRNKISASFR